MTDEEWEECKKRLDEAFEADAKMTPEEWAAWEKYLDETLPEAPDFPAEGDDSVVAIFLIKNPVAPPITSVSFSSWIK